MHTYMLQKLKSLKVIRKIVIQSHSIIYSLHYMNYTGVPSVLIKDFCPGMRISLFFIVTLILQHLLK